MLKLNQVNCSRFMSKETASQEPQAILAAMDSPSSSESPSKRWAKVEARTLETSLCIRCECGRRVCNPKTWWWIDWWLFRFRWVDSTQEDRVLVQDCAGKTASSLGMISHIHCLHGFCTQVCFCLFWFVGRFCCLALTYLGSNSNRDSYFYDRNAMCH